VPPPIVHRVTRESRSETLQHFFHTPYIYRSDHGKELYAGEKTFLFNRSRDTLAAPLFITIKGCSMEREESRSLIGHVTALGEIHQPVLSTCLPNVRVLDLVQLFDVEQNFETIHINDKALLRYCSGLEEIRLAGMVYNRPGSIPIYPGHLTAAEPKLRAEALLLYFHERHAENPSFKIPMITLHHVRAYEVRMWADAERDGTPYLNSSVRQNMLYIAKFKRVQKRG
jgi:hypothetical protein